MHLSRARKGKVYIRYQVSGHSLASCNFSPTLMADVLDIVFNSHYAPITMGKWENASVSMGVGVKSSQSKTSHPVPWESSAHCPCCPHARMLQWHSLFCFLRDNRARARKASHWCKNEMKCEHAR
eukprot:364173-Chlamydomonas_euryale.AAC.8